jgi:hypothetical protein
MLCSLILVLAAIAQGPMNTQPQFVESRLELLKSLPPHQFEGAEKIIMLGGDVWLSDKDPQLVSLNFRGKRFTDEQVPWQWPFRGAKVYGIAFVNASVSEEGIARSLEEFPAIKSIAVTQMHVGDKALAPLDRFNELENVSLGETHITSASLRHMSHQRRLQYLSIPATKIDDAGLINLERIPTLKSLDLGNTAVTSGGLKSIGKIASLESLGLHNTRVDDEGLVHLTELRSLRSIRLDGTRITNAGMAHIARLSSLKDLYMDRTEVDESGLALLQNMPKLEEVRWLEDEERATPEQKRSHAKFHLYLPANLDRWKDAREKFERGELKFD